MRYLLSLQSRFLPYQTYFVPKAEIHQFQMIEKIEENALKILHNIPQDDFQNAFLM